MPTYISGQRLSWKRFWVPWDGKISCGDDGRGFLDDPDQSWGRHANPEAKSIGDLITKRCVILSGHPGSGKTVEIERVHQELLKNLRPPDELFMFHCREIASAEILRIQTIAHPRWIQARNVGGQITLIIDGIDEGLRKVPDFICSLILFLRDEPVERVRVILVCRSAEWDIAAGENLMRLWSENERGGVHEICPLRRKDAAEAARLSKVDELAFMDAVFHHNVEGLAARPITLRMLLEEFLSSNRFPNIRKDLYSRAARRMCREVDEDRLKALRKHYQPPPEEHIYRTACKIAALLMLSGKNAVLKRDDENASAVDLHWRDVVGGVETVNGKDFEINENLVEATLETPHFSFRGPHRYGFDHPTFAECLAAEYLRDLSLVQLRQLLCQRLNGREFVSPQLAEVAAWLGTDHLEWRKFVIKTEPMLLLRTDLGNFTDDDKKRAVETLLSQADREEAFDVEHLSRFYYALNHPDLAEQLRPYILDRKRNLVVRRMAIEIAGDARIKELEPELWKSVAQNDPAFNAVTHALRDLSGPHSKPNLMKALRGEFPCDTNKDLLGVTLHILVPKILSVREVLPYLPEERDKSYSGSYDWALIGVLPDNLVAADLSTLLQQMRKWKDCFDRLSSFYHLAKRGFSLALEHLNDPTIRRLAAIVWVEKIRAHEILPGRGRNQEQSDELIGLGDDQHRRDLVKSIVESKIAIADDLVLSSTPLIDHSDLGWLLQQLLSASQKNRDKWAKAAASQVWGSERLKVCHLLKTAYDRTPELRKYLPVPRKGDICITLDRQQRAWQLRTERRQRRWKEKKRVTRRELLNRAFHVLRNINATGWVGISQYVYVEDKNDNDLANRARSWHNIENTIGWCELSDAEKREAIEGAIRFLLDYGDRGAARGQRTNYAQAAYHAIRVVRDRLNATPSLKRAISQKWIHAVTREGNNGEDEHQEQIAVVYRLNPALVKQHLLDKLRADDKQDGFALALRAYKKVWCRPLSSALSKFVSNEDLRPQTIRSILQFLALHERAVAISTIRSMLRTRNVDDFAPKSRALLTVALFSLPEEFWEKLWPVLMNAKRNKIKLTFLESAYDLYHNEGFSLDKLTDDQVADLYLFLIKIFPPETDPKHKYGQVHTVTARHQMARLRDGLLNILVARATETSLLALQRIISAAPAKRRLWLRWSYAEALKGRLRKLWTAGVLTPNEILALTRSPNARRVEDEESLREAILYSLERLQKEMSADGLPSIRDLWNEPRPNLAATPKKEEELSHLIRRWLNKDLPAKNGIVINCEVKVERFGRGRLDIKVEAFSKSIVAPRKLTVIIEVKRCSHADVATACRTQLVNGYLNDEGLTHGIYLVGWFGSWKGHSKRWKTIDDARQCVSAWVDASTKGAVSAKSFVLDCLLSKAEPPSKRSKFENSFP